VRSTESVNLNFSAEGEGGYSPKTCRGSEVGEMSVRAMDDKFKSATGVRILNSTNNVPCITAALLSNLHRRLFSR
jgi:hypothetical protein